SRDRPGARHHARCHQAAGLSRLRDAAQGAARSAVRMSACDMLRPKAAGVASLPEGDPDRIEYLAHAQGCPDCMAALRQGALVMLAASAGFAFAAGGVPGVWPQASDLVPVELMCTSFELIGAALPLAAAAWAWRKNPQPGALAQAAAAGALAGQAALHLACPGRHDAMHLWMFHVSGVLLAAVAGWLLEGQLK